MGILKSYFTYLGRNRLFALVNVLGLSVSLMFVLLIGDMVVRQLTVGHDIKNRKEVYVLTNGTSSGGHYIMGNMLSGRYPEIKEWCAAGDMISIMAEKGNERLYFKPYMVRENFFTFMGIDLLKGDAESALLDPSGIVLTESFACRLFGTDAPMGQRIKVRYENMEMAYVQVEADKRVDEYTVTGIVRDLDNSLIPSDVEAFLAYGEMEHIYPMLTEKYANRGASGTTILATFHSGCDPNAKATDLLKFLHDEQFPNFQEVSEEELAEMKAFGDEDYEEYARMSARGLPLDEVYNSDIHAYDFVQNSGNNRKILLVFSVVGLVILLMAVLNYVSMSVAQTANRAKEMATRRLLGTGRWGIAARMVGEAMVMTVMAFALAFLLALAAEPFAVELLQTKLDLAGDLSWWVALAYVLLMVVIGVLSGLAPAAILSSYSPMDVVRGTFRRKTKMLWLRLLYVVQGGLSIAMLACVMFVSAELNGILSTPLGYEYGNILRYNAAGMDAEAATFKRAAERLPFVERVCLASGNPAEGTMSFGLGTEDGNGEQILFVSRVFFTDTAFMKMFGIEVTEERNVAFSWRDSWNNSYFSESCFDSLKRKPEETVYVHLANPAKHIVCGQFRDFTVGSVLSRQWPVRISAAASDTVFGMTQVLVETTNGDRTMQRAQLDSLYAEVFEGMPFESRWYDDLLNDSYENVFRLRKIVGIFACVALLITLLGLTAMSLYFIAQRRHDMAIRKVFGSDSRRETAALMRFAMSSLAFGAVLSVPLMWFGITRMDDMIGYDAPFPWWIPLAAFAVVAAVSLLSVWLISRKAVRENPVENLKTE